MKYTALFLLAFPLLSFAETVSQAKINFCKERMSRSDSIQKIVSAQPNQLSFYNQGGLFGGGVCWWHSRFTRAAAYLAVFDPTLPKPTDDEAEKIISTIRHRKDVVVIPGYRNLYEFSRDYGTEVLSKLSDWQRSDGILKAAWVKGLKGNSSISSEELEQRMNELYERISSGEIVYQKLQMPGIVAHAWLVVGMRKITEGYELTVVDSNSYYGGTEKYFFLKGMKTFSYSADRTDFVPYTEEIPEERKLRQKLEKSCEGII